MPLIHDELLTFTGFGGVESRCRVRLFLPPAEAREDGYVIVLTDDKHAQGTSITNAAEIIAALVAAKYHLPGGRVTWIEHYEFNAKQQIPFGRTGSFARVRFEAPTEASARAAYIHGVSLGKPAWTHIDRQSVEILIGEPLP